MDAETRKLCIGYAGRDFDQPRQIKVEAFSEWGTDGWTLDEFRGLIDDAIKNIPEEFREYAKVDLGGDECAHLVIYYRRQENQVEVDERVARCIQYAKERLEGERAAYVRLKRKYESA